MDEKAYLVMAVEQARKTMQENLGGPFGAALVDANGNVFVGSNTVLGSHDPTGHAEVNVIRQACEANKTHDLTGSILYTTCYPCPMCLGACIWANIKTVYYGCTPQDAEAIGFRDDFIYRYIQQGCTDKEILELKSGDRKACLALFSEYQAMEREIY